MQAQVKILDDTEPRFRDMIDGDAMELVELAGRFFLESEFKSFTTFSTERMLQTFDHALVSPYMHVTVFENEGRIQGFLAYQTDQSYTEEPIALMYLFYVVPEYRKTPVGRELLKLSEDHARAAGCVAFYGGSMSGIPEVQKTLPNMFKKMGYETLYWGKKHLTEKTQ